MWSLSVIFAIPRVTVICLSSPFKFILVSAIAFLILSETKYAASLSELLTKVRNSSPPYLAKISLSLITFDTELATVFKTSSPALWP